MQLSYFHFFLGYTRRFQGKVPLNKVSECLRLVMCHLYVLSSQRVTNLRPVLLARRLASLRTEHDNNGSVLLPDHLPERTDRSWQGALSGYVGVSQPFLFNEASVDIVGVFQADSIEIVWTYIRMSRWKVMWLVIQYNTPVRKC